MKKNVFVAMLLAVVMVLSCLMVTVSAEISIEDNAPATGNYISYANAAVVPAIDGKASEKVWASTTTIDGIKALWADNGFYFATGLNAEFTYADIDGETAKTISVVNGAVTGAPAGYKSFAGADTVEIFVPFTHTFEWKYHNFAQYRTQGNRINVEGVIGDASLQANAEEKTVDVSFTDAEGNAQTGKITYKVALEGSARICDFITEASDLIGTIMNINGKKVQMAGPYGFNYVMNGFAADTWADDDDDDITGTSKYDSWTFIQGITYDDFTDVNGNPIFDYQDPNDNEADGSPRHRMAISLDPEGNPLPRYGWMPAQLAYAVKVNSETAPLIDGVIDSVWETTGKFYHLNEIDNIEKDAYGYISVLWDETGLYFLGVIKDPNLTTDPTATEFDHVNFNVSETSTRHTGVEEDKTFPSTIAGMNAKGSYEFGIGPCGNLLGASGAWTEAYTAAGSAVKVAGSYDANGYIVEAYVPYFKLTAAEAKVGHVMSIESSVDNFIPGQSGRDEYTNLGGLSSYWSNPNSQFDVVFVGEYDVEAAALTMSDVYNMVNALLNPYQKTADALTAADIDGQITSYTDELEEAVEELQGQIADLEASLADYQKAADAVSAADVDAKLADYAKKADVDSAIDGIEVKDYTVVVVILFVLAVAGLGIAVFGTFIKKK